MSASLPMPHIPPGFPLLAAAGDQTTCPGGPTVPRTEAGGQTVSPHGLTAPGTEAGGPTVSPGCQTAPRTEVGGPTSRPCAAPSLSASLTSAAPRAEPTTLAAPHMVPSTPPAPRAAPTSMTPAAPLILRKFLCCSVLGWNTKSKLLKSAHVHGDEWGLWLDFDKI
jgi:hypothetical protein